jgi:uncharacterized protein DUF4082
MTKNFISLLTLTLVCGFGFDVSANTIIAPSGYTANAEPDSNQPQTSGYDFTVGSTPLLVTALGLWDGPQAIGNLMGFTGSIGDGFADPHTLNLWDSAGNLLGTTMVQAGTVNTLVGEFRFSNLNAPVVLLPGMKYVLSATFAAGDTDSLDAFFPGFPTTDPAVTGGHFRETVGSTGFPADLGFTGALIGPNAMFTLLTNGNGVPEGGTTSVMLLVCVVGLLGVRRVVRA